MIPKCLFAAVLVASASLVFAQDATTENSAESAHARQWQELSGTTPLIEDAEPAPVPAAAQEAQAASLSAAAGNVAPAAPGSLDSKWVVFGYHPSYRDGFEYHYRYWTLTHIGYSFVDFTATGALQKNDWDTRPAAFTAGGAAQAHGTKVVMVVRNDDFSASVLSTVMNNASLRSTVISNIMAEVVSDSYCAGVSLDLEFSWNATTRDNITLFIRDLSNQLKGLNPPKELSVYVHPTYSGTYWDVDAIEPYIDFMLYSCYPYAGGWSSSATAMAPEPSYDGNVDLYIQNGMPANKVVLVLPAYGHYWRTTTGAYGAATVDGGTSGSRNMMQMKFDTTLRPSPYTRQYEPNPPTAWHSYNAPNYFTAVWDDDVSLDYKMRNAKHWVGAQSTGKPLRGIGWWELAWFALDQSYDMNTSAVVGRTRTYPIVYQEMQEIFASPGTRVYTIDKFESRDPRWRDPNEGPDDSGDTDADSSVSDPVVAAPAGAGKPDNSTYAIRVSFDFENASGNRLFFRHEILGDDDFPTVADRNSAKAAVDATSKFICDVYSSAYSGRTVRMVLMDSLGQLEMSPAWSLGTSGWKHLEWDITDGTKILAYNTSESPFSDGNGIVNTAGGGKRDISFIGFLIEGGGSGSGSVYFDELSYTHANPGNANYVINEFRYNNTARQFVEIYGPAGAFPAGTELRVVSGSTGDPAATIALSGSIPNDNGGFGYYVVGVEAGADQLIAAGTLLALTPSALQLFNTNTATVYDAVTYRAFDSLGSLDRKNKPVVTENGPGWMGEVAAGTNTAGTPYTVGRFPDGANTFVNANDLSFMPATPGAPNGNTLALGTVMNFDTAPANAFRTYQTFSVQPVAAGIPASPNGGNVHRVVDTSGGGNLSVFGDASLGAGGTGYEVAGNVYVPAAAEPLQANGVGFCGRLGSTFFTNTPAGSGYESGYWLIYENAAGVGLNDGRPDHPGVVEFVWATNDGQDATPVTLLGSRTLAELGVTAGNWTHFVLTIDPAAAPSQQLVAQINHVDVYRGPIPTGGPISGAFQAGFRENHTGTPVASEGTWIDGVMIAAPGGTPVTVSGWSLE